MMRKTARALAVAAGGAPLPMTVMSGLAASSSAPAVAAAFAASATRTVVLIVPLFHSPQLPGISGNLHSSAQRLVHSSTGGAASPARGGRDFRRGHEKV